LSRHDWGPLFGEPCLHHSGWRGSHRAAEDVGSDRPPHRRWGSSRSARVVRRSRRPCGPRPSPTASTVQRQIAATSMHRCGIREPPPAPRGTYLAHTRAQLLAAPSDPDAMKSRKPDRSVARDDRTMARYFAERVVSPTNPGRGVRASQPPHRRDPPGLRRGSYHLIELRKALRRRWAQLLTASAGVRGVWRRHDLRLRLLAVTRDTHDCPPSRATLIPRWSRIRLLHATCSRAKLIGLPGLTELWAGSDFAAIRPIARKVEGAGSSMARRPGFTNSAVCGLALGYDQPDASKVGGSIAGVMVRGRQTGLPPRSAVRDCTAATHALAASRLRNTSPPMSATAKPVKTSIMALPASTGALTYVTAMCCWPARSSIATLTKYGSEPLCWRTTSCTCGLALGNCSTSPPPKTLESMRALTYTAARIIDAKATPRRPAHPRNSLADKTQSNTSPTASGDGRHGLPPTPADCAISRLQDRQLHRRHHRDPDTSCWASVLLSNSLRKA